MILNGLRENSDIIRVRTSQYQVLMTIYNKLYKKKSHIHLEKIECIIKTLVLLTIESQSVALYRLASVGADFANASVEFSNIQWMSHYIRCLDSRRLYHIADPVGAVWPVFAPPAIQSIF